MKVAIVGGGMYGCVAAEHLQYMKHDVTVYEKEDDILLGASSKNFHRLHRGFHYPLSYKTALESRAAYDGFIAQYGEFCKLIETIYWLAEDSRVQERQYRHFLDTIGLPFKRADWRRQNTNFGVFCEESIYDVNAMREYFRKNLKIVVNSEIKDYADADVIIDCTYVDSPLVEKWELKESTVLLISANLPHMAQTVLYGPYCGLIPDGDKFRFYHASEVAPRKMMEAGVKFFPELKTAVIHEVISCKHAHPASRTDDRPYRVQQVGKNKIAVLSGKIAQSVDCAREIALTIESLGIVPDEGSTGKRAAVG